MIPGLTNSINTYLIITLYGSLVMLSVLLVTNALKVNRKANLFFGVFLFLWSTYWLEEIISLIETTALSGSIELALRALQFLTPIFFYFSTVLYSNPDFKFKLSHLKYLMVPAIYLVILILSESSGNNENINLVLIIMILFHALYYVYLSYRTIQKHKAQLTQFSSTTEEKDLQWLEFIIISLLSLAVFMAVYNLLFQADYLNLFANFFSCCIVFFVAFHVIRQKEIFHINQEQRNEIIGSQSEKTNHKRRPIISEELELWKQKLENLMSSEQPYLNPDLSLLMLSEHIKLTPHQLSYLINEGFGENFFTFINRHRIEMVKKLISEAGHKQLSIIGLAYECGFNSKTAFYRTFKKITNSTPSDFVKKSSTL